MATDTLPRFEECTCLAVRQAARRITQFYDQHLAPFGLRTTQFSILAKLKQLGPMTINALADEMVMDRTTLGRNILPLEREGLISITPGRTDRRSKELRLTEAGILRLGISVYGLTRFHGAGALPPKVLSQTPVGAKKESIYAYYRQIQIVRRRVDHLGLPGSAIRGRKIGRRNLAEQGAQAGGALFAEGGREPRLRLSPTQARGLADGQARALFNVR